MNFTKNAVKESEESLGKVISDLKKGKAFPCYLLYGEEEYLVKDTLQKILDLLLDKQDREFNLFSIDGDQQNLNDICESLLTLPMIPGKKVVVLKDTLLFQSREMLPDITKRIHERLDREPLQAARDFIAFLNIAGWKLDDLKDGGWKKISEAEWQLVSSSDDEAQRELWVPRIVDFCIKQGLDTGNQRDATDRLDHILKSGLPEDNHLILTADSVDKRKKLFKTISSIGVVLHFSQGKGEVRQKSKLMPMANTFLSDHGKSISHEAWQAIGRKTGYNLRNTMGAIEHLVTYAGDRAIIDEKDIEEIVSKTSEGTVFDLSAAVIAKDLRKVLVTLSELFELGSHHILIHSIISREIRHLLQVKLLIKAGVLVKPSPAMDYNKFQKEIYPSLKEKVVASKGSGNLLSQNPYVIYLALKNSERFSFNDLLRFQVRLVEMDLAFKSSTTDPKLLLEHLFADMCS